MTFSWHRISEMTAIEYAFLVSAYDLASPSQRETMIALGERADKGSREAAAMLLQMVHVLTEKCPKPPSFGIH